MQATSPQELTELLRGWSNGDESALASIVDAVYPELRRIAGCCLKGERSENTIQATALVHEAYLRLFDISRLRWQDRAHFFAMVAKLMRRILIDHARARDSSKRGGGARRLNLDETLAISGAMDPEIVRLDEALQDLARLDSRKADVVEMRYFGGLTADEIAAVLGVSTQTVNRDWHLAKAWLVREMRQIEGDGRRPLGKH